MKETIGSFILIRDEAQWIAPHIMRVLPFLDRMVFYDGLSTDGTIEIIQEIKRTHINGDRIKLVLGKDPANLQEDYVRLFNEAMRSLDTDLAVFLHPDMYVETPSRFRDFMDKDCIMGIGHMESYAGNPGEQLFKIAKGRGEIWPLVYRLKNPDLGAHYFGHYGAANEAVYFSEITGDSHEFPGQDLTKYPFPVMDVGLRVLHFSDVRSYERRLGRMKSCLLNQGYSQEEADSIAPKHERVSLKDSEHFKFIPAEYPPVFLIYQSEFSKEKHLTHA